MKNNESKIKKCEKKIEKYNHKNIKGLKKL